MNVNVIVAGATPGAKLIALFPALAARLALLTQ